jgi:transglutaminase-like putative cysteine protease
MRLSLLAAPAIAVLILAAPPAHGQAPRITPRGDPSVRNDTIYSLAVDAKDHPEETAIYLLDDGVLRLEADGRGTRTYRTVMQILRPEAVDSYQELEFSWAPRHQRFTLNWARVVRADGSVVSAQPNQRQESDVPAQLGDPVYNDTKVLRASLSGVEAGTIVDYSWTVEELRPFLAGDGISSWSISTALGVRRSRYIVDLPATLEPRIRERNLTFARSERTVGRRKVYTWAASDVPRIRSERFAADSNGVVQAVTWALPTTWQAIGAWYAGNAKDRYALTPEVEAKLAELVADARTLDDSLRAVHGWVAQDVRYVSIALGLGGYQPRAPAEVLRTGFGDCKDKATIFIAMLQRMGLEAYPVILNSTGGVIEELPSLAQFDHAIAAFKRPGGAAYEFTDLTALYTPFGELPYGPQGEFGIIVRPDGRVEEVTLPLTGISDNRMEVTVKVELTPDGRVHGTFEEHAMGNQQYQGREAFANPYDSTQRAQLADRVAGNWFTGARGSDLVMYEGLDLAAAPKVALRIVDGQGVTSAGASALMRLNVPTMQHLVAIARQLEERSPRRFPIAAQSIFGYSQHRLVLEVTMPEGWQAELPASVDLDTPFGTYRKTYGQSGRVLRVERFVAGKSGTFPPERLGELTAFFRAAAADDATSLVIRR